MFKAVLAGADLVGAFLHGAQFLTCAQLLVTRNWQSAFRDEALGCGAAIPAQGGLTVVTAAPEPARDPSSLVLPS